MRRSLAVITLLCFVGLGACQAFASATITIVNNNAPGVGFNDPTPATPVGGNPGTTLGELRLNSFKEAARIWGQNIDSAVEIQILASFEPLSCTATAATLGSAGTIFIFRDFGADTVGFFPGPEFAGTWYHSALADKRAGQNLAPGQPDIRARFNSNLGQPNCLAGQFWYYGFDNNQAANQINLVTVLLHEFAHGLGFSQFASVTNGMRIQDLPDVYNRLILDNTTGKTWLQMTDAERVASSINPRNVVFTGTTVTDAVPGVLQHGVPTLQVNAPTAIAGKYEVGPASFGPQLTSAAITGKVVLAQDPANVAGPSTTDGCSPLTNATDVAGNIAMIDRGTCTFVVKVKNAQLAGAVAVIIADNAPGAPPAALGGADPTITIPSIRISLPDANLMKAQLGAGLFVTLGVDMSRLAGADSNNHALLYTPTPVAPGSTISHWDTIDIPNQLMEPNINQDLTHEVKPPVDLTLPLLRDVGWFADEDNDGIPDASDQCLGSNLTPGPISINGCDTTINNVLFSTGCTVIDLITRAAVGESNHGGYVSNIAHLGNSLNDSGIISGAQKGKLQSCAAGAPIP